jgi:hypothetical protein
MKIKPCIEKKTPRTPAFLLSTFYVLLLPVLPSCGTSPLRGGRAITTGPIQQSLTQGQNPQTPSRQTQETTRTRTYAVPAAEAEPTSRLAGLAPQVAGNSSFIIHPSSFLVTDQEHTTATTELGSAQKDTAREWGAKLSSLKGIVWIGVLLFVFGIASIFWPPLKLIIGSLTTSVAVSFGGLALIILPTLIVGNELLILGGVAACVGAWFLAHRHGHLRGQLASLSPKPVNIKHANPNK